MESTTTTKTTQDSEEELNYLPEGSFAGSSIDTNETRLSSIERLLHTHRHSTADRTQVLRSIPPLIKTLTTGGSTYIVPVEECDMLIITAQDAAITFSNPTQSAYQGQKVLIRIKDDTTARAITWGSAFRASTIALPTTTVSGKHTYLGFMYNTDDAKWDLIATVTTV